MSTEPKRSNHGSSFTTHAAPTEQVAPTTGALSPRQLAELVEQYTDLVRRIANQIHRRSPPSVQRDDLIAAGMSGLWDALRRRGDNRDARFDFYVCTRVRGAIIDELRAEDWLPRRRSRTAEGGGAPRATTSVVHFEDLGLRDQRRVAAREFWDEDDAVESKMSMERVMSVMSRLPERERYVLMMRDIEGVAIKDLGEELGVSKPRICQLRTQALRRLREYLLEAAA